MKIQAIILDFDDTLCLSEEACFELENEVLQRMGRAPQERAIHKQTWGMQIDKAMLERSPGVDMEQFWQLMPVVHQEFVTSGRIDQIPEVNLETLDLLALQNFQLFILTSRTEKEATHLLDPSHHLAARITEFYHADNTTYIKPDPRVFDTLLKTHNLNPQACVYVGDSPSDGSAANAAGMKFIASFESGLRTPEDFAHTSVDATIQHFTELPDAITRLS